MSFSIVPNGSGVALKKNVNLTPASPGCSIVAGSTICRLTFAIAPGSYLATIDTYDAIDEGGNMVSHGERLPLQIVADHVNAVPLVLGGVPHALSVVPGAGIITGTQSAGFTVGGAAPLIVNATDADGNTIVGAGTPYAGSVVSGSGWNIASAPNAAAPDQLQITPGAAGSAATLKIAVAYDAATCALPGVVCSVTFAATSQPVQYLFVADCERTCHTGSDVPDAVDVYAAPYTGAPIATITQGMHNPVSVAVDASGRLFVANCAQCFGSGVDTVTVYAPPYSSSSTPVATLTTGVFHPEKLALNSAGDLFVWNCFQGCRYDGADTITRYSGTLNDA
ncbi:MAG TPA: hypothetical protein VGP41_17355, partial [Candidatus Lustribacter sp.]|nr:hypothetical protein [Candidatus Lustribacter sp.]